MKSYVCSALRWISRAASLRQTLIFIASVAALALIADRSEAGKPAKAVTIVTSSTTLGELETCG
jgi:hypothetical protein